MQPTNATPQPAKLNDTATKQLFKLLGAFLDPVAKSAGLTLRPFSVQTFISMQLAGIAVGSPAWKGVDSAAQTNQLAALLVIQTAPLDELAPALRAAAGDFDAFYWDFVFPRLASVPIEGLLAIDTQLSEELPAVEAAMVETQVPPSMAGDGGEKAPGN